MISCQGRFELDRNDAHDFKLRPRVGYLSMKQIRHSVPSSKYFGEIQTVTEKKLTIDAIFEISFDFEISHETPSKMKLDQDVWTRVEENQCQ